MRALSDRPLDPPEMDLTDTQEERQTAIEYRKADAYAAAMREILTGKGPFWGGSYVQGREYPAYDNEQAQDIMRAVRVAFAAIGLDDAARAALLWRMVNDAVSKAGGEYASYVAEETG